MHRCMDVPLTGSGDRIASRCRHLKLIKYYTDTHNVDEDSITVSYHGGRWQNGRPVGIALRELLDNPTLISDVVASSNIAKILDMRIIMMSTKI